MTKGLRMRSPSRVWLLLMSVSSLALTLTNCTNPYGSGSGGGGPIPSPSPTATITPTPAPCGTPDRGNPNLVVVAMGGGLAASTIAPYPFVSGYAVSDLSFDVPSNAGLIDITAFGSTTPITTQSTLQFYNDETLGSTVVHSAYGFTSSTFPGSFAFPSPLPSPMATTIANGVTWYTGRIQTQDSTGDTCFSPEFKLSKGTYYFGDVDYYNPNNFRSILIVGTPSPLSLAKSHSRGLVRQPYRSRTQPWKLRP